MLIEIEMPNGRADDAIVVRKNDKWKLVNKSAYLEPYMRRNEATEAKFAELRKEHEALEKSFEELLRRYSDLSDSFDAMKEAVNGKLKEYHDVLRVLTNGQ